MALETGADHASGKHPGTLGRRVDQVDQAFAGDALSRPIADLGGHLAMTALSQSEREPAQSSPSAPGIASGRICPTVSGANAVADVRFGDPPASDRRAIEPVVVVASP